MSQEMLINDMKVMAINTDKIKDVVDLRAYLNDNRVTDYEILELKDGIKIGLEVSMLKGFVQNDLDIIEPENLNQDILSLISDALKSVSERIKEDYQKTSGD